MTRQLNVASYLEPYAQRLYDARKREFRTMSHEALLLAVGEALEIVCATEEEIEAVAGKVRAQIRDDALPRGTYDPSDDGLLRRV